VNEESKNKVNGTICRVFIAGVFLDSHEQINQNAAIIEPNISGKLTLSCNWHGVNNSPV
jgi:hypothetical protein